MKKVKTSEKEWMEDEHRGEEGGRKRRRRWLSNVREGEREGRREGGKQGSYNQKGEDLDKDSRRGREGGDKRGRKVGWMEGRRVSVENEKEE